MLGELPVFRERTVTDDSGLITVCPMGSFKQYFTPGWEEGGQMGCDKV